MRVAILAVLVVVAGTARADEVAVEGDDEGAQPKLIPATGARPEAAPGRVTHKGQVGGSVRVGMGLRAIKTYDDVDYCGQLSTQNNTGNDPVCIGRAPMSFDLEVSYGVAVNTELLAEIRLGVERDFGSVASSTGGPRPHFFAPGARFFFNEAKTSKLFSTVQLVIDWTGYNDAGGEGRGADFGGRNLNGLWFDLHKAYGFYIFVGETLTARRWLRFELEAGIGIQGRYP